MILLIYSSLFFAYMVKKENVHNALVGVALLSTLTILLLQILGPGLIFGNPWELEPVVYYQLI